MFFSEEKNQKTVESGLYQRFRPWPESWDRLKHKSLLLIFFRKEDFLLFSGQAHARARQAH
jgi:hypothetical protein